MFKRQLKLYSLVLCNCLLAGAIIGCSGNNGGKQETAASSVSPTEQATKTERAAGQSEKMNTNFRMMMLEYPKYPIKPEKQKVFQWIYEATGVKPTIEAVPVSNYEDKKSVMLATNNLPDVLLVEQKDLNEYGRKGAFVNLSEYIDQYAPNLKKAAESIPDFHNLYVDGKLYGFPRINYDFTPDGSAPAIRTDVLAELNLQVPGSFDELYEVLKKMKEAYPDSVPWTVKGFSSISSQLAFAFGTTYGLGFDPDVEGGKYTYGTIKPEMKELLAYLNKLYTEKLLDPDFAVNTNQVYVEKLSSNKSFFYFDNINFTDEYNSNLQKSNPDAQFEMIPFLKNSQGKARGWVFPSQWALGQSYAISSKVSDPLPIIQFFDWLYSEEGSNITNYGKEGETYSIVDGKPEFLPSMIKETKGESDKYKEVELGLTLNVFAHHISQRQWNANQKDYMNSLSMQRSMQLKNDPGYYILPSTSPSFTEDEMEKIKQIGTKIDTIAEESVMKFIMGAKSLNEFDAFVEEMKSNGALELEKIYNDANARAK